MLNQPSALDGPADQYNDGMNSSPQIKGPSAAPSSVELGDTHEEHVPHNIAESGGPSGAPSPRGGGAASNLSGPKGRVVADESIQKIQMIDCQQPPV